MAVRDGTRLVRRLRPRVPTDWTDAPTGWPGEIEAGLLDAVLSIRATYGRPTTGVRAAVQRWREQRGGVHLDDLRVFEAVDADSMADVVHNRQRLADGSLKTVGLLRAAQRLRDVGVTRTRELRADSPVHRAAVADVPGLGDATWHYLTLVTDAPQREPSPRVADAVRTMLGSDVSPAATNVLLAHAAEAFDVDVMTLELAVWRLGRAR